MPQEHLYIILQSRNDNNNNNNRTNIDHGLYFKPTQANDNL